MSDTFDPPKKKKKILEASKDLSWMNSMHQHPTYSGDI